MAVFPESRRCGYYEDGRVCQLGSEHDPAVEDHVMGSALDVEVGSCALCGQEMLRSPDGDVWHSWTVFMACPPEPSSNPFDVEGWQRFHAAGLRVGRPGPQHFQPRQPLDNPSSV